MKMKTKTWLSVLMLLLCSYSYGQKGYHYTSELLGIKNQWHKLVLPDEIFGKIAPDFSDLRIYGEKANGDTVEAPYFITYSKEESTEKAIEFKVINQTKTSEGYFLTFEMPTEINVNQILLEFKQQNFDWEIDLSGSQNQNDWFSILEDYRILSIKNELTNYQFTKIAFSDAKYKYFRLLIKSPEKPDLVKAKITRNEIVSGSYRNYTIISSKITEELKEKQTIINLDLKMPVPVNRIMITVKDQCDFYRPVSINYLSDSVLTEKGWKYYYSNLYSGTLNSLEKNEFNFSPILVKNLKIIVDNQDNKPLEQYAFKVEGPVYQLIARFTDPASYYLTYGNPNAATPNYDITKFSNKIPSTLTELTLGKEQTIQSTPQETAPLFENKLWLWGIIGIIILILGVFTLKMMSKKET